MAEEQQTTEHQAPTATERRSLAAIRGEKDDLTRRVRELEEQLSLEESAKLSAQQSTLQELEKKLGLERVERARAQARNQFRDADPELLAEYPSADPDEILRYAQKLHEKAQYRLAGMAGVPFPPTNQSDVALTAEEGQIRRWQTAVRNNHLRKTLDPIEAEQAFEVFFRRGWNSHMEERKRRAGLSIAPISAPSQ